LNISTAQGRTIGLGIYELCVPSVSRKLKKKRTRKASLIAFLEN
jgi:hypothetical protein